MKSPATGEAGNASSIIGAQGRRCMRFVHFQVPLEGELRAGVRGRDDVIPIGGVGRYVCVFVFCPQKTVVSKGARS